MVQSCRLVKRKNSQKILKKILFHFSFWKNSNFFTSLIMKKKFEIPLFFFQKEEKRAEISQIDFFLKEK